MASIGVMDVYRKIKEINQSNIDGIKPVSIDHLVLTLNDNKEIIQEYITALTVLELIKPVDSEDMLVAC